MLSILIASFVVACTLTTITLAIVTIRREKQTEDIILAAEPLKPEWIYGPRMDVPRKWPILRTRNSKVLR
jgi:hypothetical protein